ncbi:putative thiamine biosynthesis oxidoreductase ThiO [Paractinoplanes abujensis]|uniref:glycine oxidase n=1 Tax=Paractinoplanes abujensis TaxID=882441 RepID=A0A7W7CVS7_9ACTN|nr:glycine oxidase ThiO [Actinoplanes abujensis]MBB4695329.1 glycine oxidase [Actinoplanes abujensis]GID24804.1 putative thiamine biosynthesis oxidoreductase ThiO [Actinoplanes abujensis]
MSDITVVGGGIIGLSIAWRLVRRGADVTVLDGGDEGAWHVAAGMLAPGGESEHEDPALIALLERSAQLWPAYVRELGVDVGYDDTGTLGLALTADDLAQRARLWTRQQLPLLRPSELRELEPALSPRVRAGVLAPRETQVDPRKVVHALRERLGTRIVVKRVESLADVDSRQVVVAAGCGTAALTGLPIRPVKGQVLRLRGEPGLLRHVLDGCEVYIVPRADGEVVVGATQEERADRLVTAGGVHELLRAALELVPGLAEFELAETTVGHRPGTPDNAPLLGRLDDRVIVAAGHFRNGILLAPVTADLVAGLVLDGLDTPGDFAPRRFS